MIYLWLVIPHFWVELLDYRSVQWMKLFTLWKIEDRKQSNNKVQIRPSRAHAHWSFFSQLYSIKQVIFALFIHLHICLNYAKTQKKIKQAWASSRALLSTEDQTGAYQPLLLSHLPHKLRPHSVSSGMPPSNKSIGVQHLPQALFLENIN